MPDLTLIVAVLNSLKTATDIARFLRESGLSLEKAELKLKLADLVGSLSDTKMQIVELQEVLAEKTKKIEDLEAAFESRDSLVRHCDAYYAKDLAGNPIGVPYCLRCWEVDHKKRQLVHDCNKYHNRVCTACGKKYDGLSSDDIQLRDKS